MEIDKNTAKIFDEQLLEWYDKNARVLPWRDAPTPYRVWVSEIMLQQTRVDTVKPYFEKFMQALPTVEELACVDEQRLLKLWEGLGYYHRAKNLRKAAQIVMEQYGGELPDDPKELKKLPGIGEYSSGAIASIAYNRRVAAIDGNVLRVMARWMAIAEDINDSHVKKHITNLVIRLLPRDRIGAFNQAMMELGATVCLPGAAPKCSECPIKGMCAAKASGMVEKLPIKSKKSPRKIEERTILLLVCGEKVAITKRPEKGLLAGLWELPNQTGALLETQCGQLLSHWGVGYTEITPLKAAKHVFTHIEWHMTGYLVLIEKIPIDSAFKWATWQELTERYALPSAFRPYMETLNDLL